MSRYVILIMLLGFFLVTQASALTNSSATITWNKTTDPMTRYEIRWKNWTLTDWQTVATDLDSTLGLYQHTFSPLPDSTGDRWACWDLRSKKGTLYSPWLSATNQQVCNQIPLAASPTPTPTPIPVPVPPPVASGLVISSQTPLEIVITGTGCLKVTTSTKGSTATVQKRTITCVK